MATEGGGRTRRRRGRDPRAHRGSGTARDRRPGAGGRPAGSGGHLREDGRGARRGFPEGRAPGGGGDGGYRPHRGPGGREPSPRTRACALPARRRGVSPPHHGSTPGARRAGAGDARRDGGRVRRRDRPAGGPRAGRPAPAPGDGARITAGRLPVAVLPTSGVQAAFESADQTQLLLVARFSALLDKTGRFLSVDPQKVLDLIAQDRGSSATPLEIARRLGGWPC